MVEKKIKLVWAIVITEILLVSIGAFVKIQYSEMVNYLLILGLFLFITAWLIIFVDIKKHKVYNKTFWLMSMFILPALAIVAYLPQRNKLFRLAKN